jgi:hypothetical protein
MTGAPPEKTTQKSAAKRQRERRKQREEHLIKRQDFRTRLTILPIAGSKEKSQGPGQILA